MSSASTLELQPASAMLSPSPDASDTHTLAPTQAAETKQTGPQLVQLEEDDPESKLGPCPRSTQCFPWLWAHSNFRKLFYLSFVVSALLVFYWYVAKTWITDQVFGFMEWLNGLGIAAFPILLGCFIIMSIPFMQGYFILELLVGFVFSDRVEYVSILSPL